MEVAVIGLGEFGSSIAKSLELEGGNVLAVDINAKKVKKIAPFVTQTAILDATDDDALADISIEHFDSVIIGIGQNSFENSLLCALNLVKLGVTDIIAKASTESHIELLKKIGVSRVVNPEKDMGKKIARQFTRNSVLEYIYLSDDIEMESVLITDKHMKLVDKTIEEINLRKKFKINIICIKRDKDIIIVDRDTKIINNDEILIVGKSEYINVFEKKYGLRKVK